MCRILLRVRCLIINRYNLHEYYFKSWYRFICNAVACATRSINMPSLCTLPKELIVKILFNVPLDVCTNLCRASKQGTFETMKLMYGVCIDRQSTTLYLGQFFNNPSKLLYEMYSHDVYISGSRALDFFVPGSATIGSDFDFYMPFNQRKVNTFMIYMGTIGVRWYSIIEYFTMRLNSKSGVATISEKELVYLYQNMDVLNIQGYVRDAVLEMMGLEPANTSTCTVKDEDGKSILFTIQSGDYGHLDIVRGHMEINGRLINIQLMLIKHGHHTNTVLDTISKFHMTAVQCAITGFAAFHMYAPSTYNMQFSKWGTDYSRREHGMKRIANSIEKYESRGYKVVERTKSHLGIVNGTSNKTKRNMGDPGTHVIIQNLSQNPLYSKPSVLRMKLSKLLEYSWIEHGNRIEIDIYRDLHYVSIACHCTNTIRRNMNTESHTQYTPRALIEQFYFGCEGDCHEKCKSSSGDKAIDEFISKFVVMII